MMQPCILFHFLSILLLVDFNSEFFIFKKREMCFIWKLVDLLTFFDSIPLLSFQLFHFFIRETQWIHR